MYLMHAQLIVSSYGGILYTNQIFFGMNTKIYVMCITGTPITNYYKIIERTKEIISLSDRNLDGRPDLTNFVLNKVI